MRARRKIAETVHSRLHYARKALAAKLGAAAKKPGGRALLLALALACTAALGAAVAFVGDAAFSRVRRDEQAQDTAGQGGGDLQIAAESPDGGRESAAPLPLPTFDFGRSTFGQPTQEMTTMNATTLRSFAASAAIAATLSTGAAISASADSAEPLHIRHLADTYLQSDGTQAINLEYYANPKTRVEVVFEPVSTNGTSYVFGSAFSSASDFQEGLYMQNGEVNFICGDLWSGTGNAWGLGSGVKATRSRFTAILDVKGSSATLKSGDSIVWSKAIASTRTKTDNIPLHVFANPHPYRESGSLVLNPRDFASVKLFSLAAWDDDVLVRDLVPYGRGGVLADLGGMPMWYPVRETGEGAFAMSGQEETSVNRAALRIGVSAWWMDPALRRETKAYPTEVAKEAGYRGDPAGESATRFLTTGALREGDEFIPILVAKDNAGRDAVAAAVTRFGDTGGCTILSGLYGRGQSETVDETTQARYLARSLAICFAEGVEQYYWYELRANENDPFYSENHFGLMHHNLTPKPAWEAYLNFTLARPAGSVQMPGPWHDEKREFFFPQWTRPDGANAGILWKTGCTEKRTLRFSGDRISFRDHTGRILKPARTPEGDHVIPVSADPLYFEGGALVP